MNPAQAAAATPVRVRPSPWLAAPVPWESIVLALAALLALNAQLSFGPWWPTPGVVLQGRLAPEMVAVWLALLALAARPVPPSPRVLWLLAATVLVLVLGRYADVTEHRRFKHPPPSPHRGQCRVARGLRRI